MSKSLASYCWHLNSSSKGIKSGSVALASNLLVLLLQMVTLLLLLANVVLGSGHISHQETWHFHYRVVVNQMC